MGYDRAAGLPVVRIRFPDHPGLVVVARGPSLAAEVLGDDFVRAATPAATARALRRLLGPMATCVHSWTLEHAGRPLPRTAVALAQLDTPFLLELVSAWLEASKALGAATPAPAAEKAEEAEPDGRDREFELGLPMEPLGPADTEPAAPVVELQPA